VFAEGNQTLVYVVQADSTVSRRAVTLGTRLSDEVEVVQGLEPGQRVVVAGHQKLFETAKVIPIQSQGGGGAGGAGGGAPGGAAAGGANAGKGAAPGKSPAAKPGEQSSVITIEFELSRDVEQAANDVRDRVARVRGRLPREADDPIVAKVDVNAQPIFWIALSSDRHSGLELSEMADVVLKERLQRLPGVGSVFIGGERRYAMRVWLDSQLMASHRVTTQDVERAGSSENREIPGGRVEGTNREFAVRTRGELTKPEEFASIVIAQHGTDIVRLGDVASVEVGPEDERTAARWNGQQAVGLGIVKQKNASTLEVAGEVRRSLPELQKLVPAGMKLDVAYDSSSFIQDSITEVSHTIVVAMCLVVL